MVRLVSFLLGFVIISLLILPAARAQGATASSGQTPPPPVNPITGPSFPCPQPEDPLANLVCSTPQLALQDMQFVQAYEALYQQAGAAGDPTLRREDIDFDTSVRSKCGISTSQVSNPSPLPPPSAPEGAAQCVFPLYQQQTALWKSMLQGDAVDEANRSIVDQVALQKQLQHLGYLPPQAQIDGVFGSGTRLAIMKWQADTNQTPTGLLGNTAAQNLLGDTQGTMSTSAPPASAPASSAQSDASQLAIAKAQEATAQAEAAKAEADAATAEAEAQAQVAQTQREAASAQAEAAAQAAALQKAQDAAKALQDAQGTAP